jgi:hypothetical protein
VYFVFHFALLSFQFVGEHLQFFSVEVLVGHEVVEVDVVVAVLEQFSLECFYAFAQFVGFEVEVGVLFVELSGVVVFAFEFALQFVESQFELAFYFVHFFVVFEP